MEDNFLRQDDFLTDDFLTTGDIMDQAANHFMIFSVRNHLKRFRENITRSFQSIDCNPFLKLKALPSRKRSVL